MAPTFEMAPTFRDRWDSLRMRPALGAFVAVVAIAASSGGYFPTSWNFFSLVLYFTYSLGSYSVLGLAAMLPLNPRRGMLAAAGPAAAVAVVVASRGHALTRRVINVAAAAHYGHRLALAALPLE